jgi:hypothetical protein
MVVNLCGERNIKCLLTKENLGEKSISKNILRDGNFAFVMPVMVVVDMITLGVQNVALVKAPEKSDTNLKNKFSLFTI